MESVRPKVSFPLNN